MGHKYAQWRWKNVLLSLILLTMPMIMCAMEQEEEIKIDGMNLIEASEEGNIEIVDNLIKRGADINAVNKYASTALMKASEKGHKEVVDSLIAGGAHINVVSNYGDTALMWASLKGHKEVVDSLIKHEADINTVANDGWTALIMASRYGHKKVADNLIKAGANPYSKNSKGKDTLDKVLPVISKVKKNEELKKHIIKNRKEYVIKKYKKYLIDGKNHMEDLAALLQKKYDWYKPWGEDKGEHDEHDLKEIKQSYSFPKDVAGVIAKFTHGISDDEWAQMLRLESEQQSLK